MNYTAAKAFILDKLDRELSDQLYYHGKHHTLDVLQITKELCEAEKIPTYETQLLKTAALYHDAGFTVGYTDHELLGCSIAREALARFDYTKKEIKQICGMILATKIPQSPKNFLEEIICDADLDYLGRDDFETIGNTLFQELKSMNKITEIEAWNTIQVSFLNAHQYFTNTNKERRESKKQFHLDVLKKIVAGYRNNNS